jgi:hypothetical protein
LISLSIALTVIACRGSDDADADAGTDAGSTCYSPLRVPSREQSFSGEQGCACIQTPATAYCFAGGIATYCDKERGWSFGVDGACRPAAYERGSCASIKGTLIDAGTCPSGFAQRTQGYLGPVDAAVHELANCCYPIDVTEQNCVQAGLAVSAVEPPSDPLATRCGDGGVLRGFVVGEASPRVCCAPP